MELTFVKQNEFAIYASMPGAYVMAYVKNERHVELHLGTKKLKNIVLCTARDNRTKTARCFRTLDAAAKTALEMQVSEFLVVRDDPTRPDAI
uniref:Uncharacterized protein n=1 Tax=Pseudomonas phage HRDY3 TaxID=3236930 RepID=A0AB39CEH2_9VIRU